MDSRVMIIRHSSPSKLDHAPFGTTCKVIHTLADTFDLYKQYGSQEDSPDWQLLGTFQNDGIDSKLVDILQK